MVSETIGSEEQQSRPEVLKQIRSGMRLILITCAILFTLITIPLAFGYGFLAGTFAGYAQREELHREVVDAVNQQGRFPFRVQYEHRPTGSLIIKEDHLTEEQQDQQRKAIGKAYAEVIYQELTTKPEER
ncbi:hypothetical protein [Rubinisphaera sp. JC750]|uniref:hypothetical protein n=1 Tax=Rubinisphaera sp. JC750 TaxID=2898658 RepID=UPI001F2DB6B4|nr:hypothetical protein [Rubinisphaera sp. JC750]